MPEEEKTWYFTSLWDFKLTIKKSESKTIQDASGNKVTTITADPLHVVFVKQRLEVNDALANNLGIDKKTIVTLIKAQPGFGKRYFLAAGPGVKTTKEQQEILDQARKGVGPAIHHGVRTTQNKA